MSVHQSPHAIQACCQSSKQRRLTEPSGSCIMESTSPSWLATRPYSE